MRVRLATTQDAAGLAHVQITSYRTAYAPILPASFLAQFLPEEQTQDWHDLLSADNDEIVCVAEAQDGEIVGYALGRPRASGGVQYQYASELVAMHVLPSRQRHGIGRQLFAAMATHVKQQGCTSLAVWVLAANTARAFYEQLGGELVSWQRLDIDGAEIEEVAYGWSDIDQLRARLESGAARWGSKP